MIRSRYKAPARGAGSAPRQAVLVEREHIAPDSMTPVDWLTAALEKLRVHRGSTDASAFVLLSGGADLVGFRLRVAQSQARADMLPSCFDHAALLYAAQDKKKARFTTYHVPLRELSSNATAVCNGIVRTSGLPDFLFDWTRTPNLALLRFPVDDAREVGAAADDLMRSRLSEDFVTPLSRWLAYVWGAEGSNNPLLHETSIPSAAFVETCFARARQDVTPGIATRTISPESIWQARFWAEQYEQAPSPAAGNGKRDKAVSPAHKLGYYVLQQPAACISWPSSEETNEKLSVSAARRQ